MMRVKTVLVLAIALAGCQLDPTDPAIDQVTQGSTVCSVVVPGYKSYTAGQTVIQQPAGDWQWYVLVEDYTNPGAYAAALVDTNASSIVVIYKVAPVDRGDILGKMYKGHAIVPGNFPPPHPGGSFGTRIVLTAQYAAGATKQAEATAETCP